MQFSDVPSEEICIAGAPVEFELGIDDVEPEAASDTKYSTSVLSIPAKIFAMPFLRRHNRRFSITVMFSS